MEASSAGAAAYLQRCPNRSWRNTVDANPTRTELFGEGPNEVHRGRLRLRIIVEIWRWIIASGIRFFCGQIIDCHGCDCPGKGAFGNLLLGSTSVPAAGGALSEPFLAFGWANACDEPSAALAKPAESVFSHPRAAGPIGHLQS
jgi:hypothetical protein